METFKYKGHDLVDWGHAVDIYKDGQLVTQMPTREKAQAVVDFEVDKRPFSTDRWLEEIDTLAHEQRKAKKGD